MKRMIGQKPICELGQKCFPGINESNLEAWQVYEIACLDSMGITPQGVIAIARAIEVKDISEVLLKVSVLTGEIRELKKLDEESPSQ